jgi:hypothetical protein
MKVPQRFAVLADYVRQRTVLADDAVCYPKSTAGERFPVDIGVS